MAERKLVLALEFIERGKEALARAEKELKGLTGAQEQHNKVVQAGAGNMEMFTAKLAALAGAIGGLALFKNLIQQGLEYNETIKTSTSGIAALVSSFYTLQDAHGNTLEGAAQWGAAMEVSAGAVKKLEVMNLELATTFPQLLEVFQGGLGPAAQLGLTLDETADAAKGMINTFTAMGKPMFQARMEFRQLLEGIAQGNIRQQIAPIASAIVEIAEKATGMTMELARNQGKLAEFLAAGFERFNAAAKENAATLGVAWSNLKDAIQKALGEGTKGLFKETVDWLIKLKDSIVQNGEVTPKFKALMQDLDKVLRQVLDVVKSVVQFLVENIQEIIYWGKAFAEVWVILKGYEIINSVILAVKALNVQMLATGATISTIAPVLGAFIAGWNIGKKIDEVTGLGKALQDVFLDAVEVVGRLANNKAFQVIFMGLASTTGLPKEFLAGVLDDMKRLSTEVVLADAKFAKFGTTLLSSHKSAKDASSGIKLLPPALSDAGENTKKLQKALEGAIKEMKPFGVQIYDLDGKLKDLNETFSDAPDSIEAWLRPAVDFLEVTDDMIEGAVATALAMHGTDKAVRELAQGMGVSIPTMQDYNDQLRQIPDAASRAADALHDLSLNSLADLFRGDDALEVFQNFADGIRDIWSKMMADMIQQWSDSMKGKKDAQGNAIESPFNTTEGKAQFAMGAFSTLGNMATANNQKGQQIMAIGSAVAGIASMFGPIGAIIGAIVMAITAVVASLQDNGKKAIGLVMDEAGKLHVISEQFDDVNKDMLKKATDIYRKYYLGFRDLLDLMGVDTTNMMQTIIDYARKYSDAASGMADGSGSDKAGWFDESGTGGPAAEASGDLFSLFHKDAVGDAMKRFNDWLENGLGTVVFDALDGMFRGGFESLGITDSMIHEMMSYWSTSLNADDMFESISRFIKNVIGIQEEFAKMQMSGTELMDAARAQAGMSFADQIAEYGTGINALADTIRTAFDFEDLNLQGEKFKDALKAMGDSVAQYIMQLLQMNEQLNKSADAQMRQFSRMGLSNEQIIGLDMQEFQDLMAQLTGATTAGEMGDAFSAIQALLNEIAGAGGEGYKDLLMAMLQQARDAMNAKTQEFADAAAAQQQAIYDRVSDVMDYFTGEAYETADGLKDVSMAAIAATKALWGVAGGTPTVPDYRMGPGSAERNQPLNPVPPPTPPQDGGPILVQNEIHLAMDLCAQKLINIVDRRIETKITRNRGGLSTPMHS